jgi:serine/threonine-protein kinase
MTDFLTRYAAEPLDGKYRLIERLGAGGMGEVFKAEHVMLRAMRVIKIVRPQISSSTEAHDRFIREAQVATKVHHQNVATLYDFATLRDASAYMVWEFIDGENLSQVLRRRGKLAPRLTVRLAAEALAGLDAIHRAGIVHRDISPENLMIACDEEGVEHVKIIDLGVAKMEEGDPGMTQTGMFIGKLRYASPEHLGFVPEGQRIDGRADLYSLAIVIYEMLTGRAPFEATSPHQYYIRYSRDEALTLPDLTAIPGGPELQAVLGRALERDRTRRYANAREFAEALQRAGAAIPDENAMKTMMLPNDADDTMRLGATQSPYASTVRTDYSAKDAAPPTVAQQTPLPQQFVYTPPPPPAATPPPVAPTPTAPVAAPAAPVTVIESAPYPQQQPARRSSLVPLVIVAVVLLMVAAGGVLAYMTRSYWWKPSTETTSTTTQATVSTTTSQTASTPVPPPSTTTVNVSEPVTTSSSAPAAPVLSQTMTTPPPVTQTVVETKPKTPPKVKPVEPQPPAPTETTEEEEPAQPAPSTPSSSVHTYMDSRGDSTWNAAALDYARKQLAGTKSVAIQGSSSGDPALVEELERLFTRAGVTVSPSATTVIHFHGKLDRLSFGRKTRFADATIVRGGRTVFHYQLPREDYRTGDDPAEAFARVAADLFR